MLKRPMKIRLVIVSVCVLAGCGNQRNLGDEFVVRYVDNPNYRNVYYNSQGIFSDICVTEVVYDDKIIAIRAYPNKYETDELDTFTKRYYYLDRSKYVQYPDQMESVGLIGPIEKEQYDSVINTLEDPSRETYGLH